MPIKIIILSLFFSSNQILAEEDFTRWVEQLRKDALSQNISHETFTAISPFITLDKRVIQLQKKQPEFTQTLAGYLDKRLSKTRVETGHRMIKENRALLDSIHTQYGVNPRVVVALWGLESNYGSYMGSYPILSSLTTLAYSSRRGPYFRKELLAALQTIEDGHTTPEQMLGSWAGAMGQCQFMPWNYKQYAVDFNGDGKRDIWTTQADALASIANFLRALGWKDDLTWGHPVMLPPHFNASLVNGKTTKSLVEWEHMGVRRLNGSSLPQKKIEARVLRPARAGGKAYLIYENFDVLMKWNRSHYFVIAVGTLSDQFRP